MGLALALMLRADGPLASPACPIDQAIYRLKTAPEFEAGFAKPVHPYGLTTDLFFFLKTPKRAFWFSFSVSQGHSTIAIVPSFDPHHDTSNDPVIDRADKTPPAIPFAAFDADLATFDHPPNSADRPPARIFSAGLDAQLYYNFVALADGDRTAEREEMPESMFEPARCATRPN